MKRTKTSTPLNVQIRQKILSQSAKPEIPENSKVISTGSTLLDLAISGGVVRGGGLPGGILVEIFGPASCGKTVLLCEIAGAVQRQGGSVIFFDPEARINKQFASIFGVNITDDIYRIPDTVTETFKPIREWKPPSNEVINGVFADSLAALSTQWEQEDKDQYGGRRAKEFSEELRKTCRILKKKNILMVCSNQIRENLNASPYEPKYYSPGGMALGFYASVRLQCSSPTKIPIHKIVGKKEVTRVVGVHTTVKVEKNSIDRPYRTALLYIIYDYGIDDIRSSLQFVKEYMGHTVYMVGDKKLSNSMDESIRIVEEEGLTEALREEVVSLWNEIESGFYQARKPKRPLQY